MNDIQLELTRLIGEKELTFGCVLKYNKFDYEWFDYYQFLFTTKDCYGLVSTHSLNKDNEFRSYNDKYEIIGHPATETDFKRWMNGKYDWQQTWSCIFFFELKDWNIEMRTIEYDSSKELLEQKADTITQIISLIKSNYGGLKN